MFIFRLHHLFLFFVFCISSLFSFSDRLSEDTLVEHCSFSRVIISYWPDLIKKTDGVKIYIKEEYIPYLEASSEKLWIEAEDGSSFYAPTPLKEGEEYFYFAKKPFKNVCNKCKFEWEAGGIVIWCPNCGTTDIRSNVPNK